MSSASQAEVSQPGTRVSSTTGWPRVGGWGQDADGLGADEPKLIVQPETTSRPAARMANMRLRMFAILDDEAA
ncbi:hypothetical protein EF879_20355 [Micromonospora sp. HM5-17]|nr:hypothetical protein EF879_20355 [Micromonospora sp. HM5-17]